MKVLLVEDHAPLAQISSSQLREIYNHEVVHAPDGKSAIAEMANFRPDLVLLDLHLPDMIGYEVARQIRAGAEWDSVVIVALTGFGSEVDPSKAGNCGIDAYFRKPMDFDVLPHLRREPPQLP